MNPIEKSVRSLDAWQQRHRFSAFTFAVIKKFGDDQAGNLVALLTYFAFVATFPLLLALSGILGILLKGNVPLQTSIQTSALSEFPIIGTQLSSQVGVASLGHSAPALIIGIVGAVLGGRGLGSALQNTLNTLWLVPKEVRPGFPSNYIRSFGLLGLIAVGTIVSTATASLLTLGHALGISGVFMKAIALAISTIIDVGLFFAAFRFGAAKFVETKNLVLSAILSGLAWQLLLSFAGIIIRHYLRHAQAVAGFFGVVLGLLAWFALQATVTVYAIEADVVRAHHLWPRTITQPPLNEADKQYIVQATNVEKRRPEQTIEIEFKE